MAGTAHGPRNVDENIAQAKAAAGRTATILSKDHPESQGIAANVDAGRCAVCLTCVRLCPFNVPRVKNYAPLKLSPYYVRNAVPVPADAPNRALRCRATATACI
ncbi:hypothetical protein ABDB91_07835 [Desulfoscipio sp. XC116]|uniref:hypothetical protein n=1 Tax=Desulfoscipio sp. XC116 TaxID=3144975 RepID=UPI00325C2333